MKNQSISHLFYGIASGLFVWSVYELVLQVVARSRMNDTVQIGICGIVLGIFLGGAVLLKDGVFHNSAYKIKRGLLFGALLGLLGGLISFIFLEFAYTHTTTVDSPFFIKLIVITFQWLVISLLIGVGINVRDGSSSIVARNITIGAISGIIGGLVFTLSDGILSNPFWARGIGLTVITTVFSVSVYYSSISGRTSWLKALNGKLEGTDFELTKEIHYLGTQSNDDINLKSYQEIRPTHAKLIRYHSGYSIIDNDPFWQTFVNFRNIREQPLKNGDIIKIGQALFQYCATN